MKVVKAGQDDQGHRKHRRLRIRVEQYVFGVVKPVIDDENDRNDDAGNDEWP